MKHISTKLILAGLFTTSLLNAGIDFNLANQHFSKAIEGQYQGARYELPKAFVSTNLKYTEGRYTTKNDNGYFKVELKEAKVNWSVSLDISYYLSGETRSIKLIDENGQSIVLSFFYKKVVFNSKKVVSNLSASERITVEFLKNGKNIELYINGAKVGTAVRENFGKLKFTEVQLVEEYDRFDDLNSLTIGSR